jgi:Na+/H+ antiporter NhaA
MLFWGLLGVLWIALQLIAGNPVGLMSIAWAALKLGLGTLVAALVAGLLARLPRPRRASGQP